MDIVKTLTQQRFKPSIMSKAILRYNETEGDAYLMCNINGYWAALYFQKPKSSVDWEMIKTALRKVNPNISFDEQRLVCRPLSQYGGGKKYTYKSVSAPPAA